MFTIKEEMNCENCLTKNYLISVPTQINLDLLTIWSN